MSRSITVHITICAALMHGVPAAALASEAEAAKQAEEESFDRHQVSIFLGGGVRDEEETESGFSGGVAYEFRLQQYLGIGLLAEFATGSLRNMLVVAPIALHPWRGLRFVVAPGAEIEWGGDALFAARFGVGYEFEIGRFTVAPEFNADLIEGTPTYVAGMSFGIGF